VLGARVIGGQRRRPVAGALGRLEQKPVEAGDGAARPERGERRGKTVQGRRGQDECVHVPGLSSIVPSRRRLTDE